MLDMTRLKRLSESQHSGLLVWSISVEKGFDIDTECLNPFVHISQIIVVVVVVVVLMMIRRTIDSKLFKEIKK